MSAPSLPPDIERCPGVGEQEGHEWFWREGCDDCARRFDPFSGAPPGSPTMAPPPIVVFECEARLSPSDALLIQRHREGQAGQRPSPETPSPPLGHHQA